MTLSGNFVLLGLSLEFWVYILLGTSAVLFLIYTWLFMISREKRRWYVGKPYEPISYLVFMFLGEDEESRRKYVMNSIAATLYELFAGGYLSLSFISTKSIMGTMKKMKVKKNEAPDNEILRLVYEHIPEGHDSVGLFGDEKKDDYIYIDVDDIISNVKVDNTFIEDFYEKASKEYISNYGNPTVNLSGVMWFLFVFSILLSASMIFVGSRVRGYFSWTLYGISVFLIVISLLGLRLKRVWVGQSRLFRSRWLGFRESVYNGSADIDDFYDLFSYAISLGIIDHYLEYVKKLVLDGKLKMEKPKFVEDNVIAFADLKEFASSINVIAGALGGRMLSGNKAD